MAGAETPCSRVTVGFRERKPKDLLYFYTAFLLVVDWTAEHMDPQKTNYMSSRRQ
jgi:hypothetical protein